MVGGLLATVPRVGLLKGTRNDQAEVGSRTAGRTMHAERIREGACRFDRSATEGRRNRDDGDAARSRRDSGGGAQPECELRGTREGRTQTCGERRGANRTLAQKEGGDSRVDQPAAESRGSRDDGFAARSCRVGGARAQSEC